ncbi:MAG: phenylalanine--tRNA ligase subunit beta [Candidatus Diapherotrites archaeon]|uniref:phenylalanine--tRNA ligase n=1 Tax=Candidatus Iainarchaeum sp. TaxID=3101447 RepID=A0A7K4C052_9ARCH|nr:phenylalanine--tRNA ligase subunit beta [Candidatus Diapherotrites archaeon]
MVMPKIDVSIKDLESLSGIKLSSREKIEELLEFVKGEVDVIDGDNLKIDCKDPNRPDFWSVEGVARELKAKTGKQKGIVKYKVQKSNIVLNVDKNLEKIRPLIVCAVIKDIKITENLLNQMIQLQEKLGESFGRKRKELAIGIYDLDIMKPPIFYKGFKDNEIEFIPLEWKVPMRPSEILIQHDKGKAYKHLLEGTKLYPIVLDSNNVVASMPPIINSQITGKVTSQTKNLFIEVTGQNFSTIETALEVMCMALADRGGKIYSCTVNYPSNKKPYPAKKIITPLFSTEKIVFSKKELLAKTGLELKDKEIIELLAKARFVPKISKDKIIAEYSSYRIDILHAVDVIEDLLISYGFNNIVPQKIEMNLVGSQSEEARYIDFVREGAIGLGLQEVQTYNLTSKEIQQKQMLLDEKEEFVEIANYVSLNYQIFRKKMTPQLLSFLSKNKSQEYPQRIFEIGTVLELDKSKDSGVNQRNVLCVAITHSNTNFTEIKSVLVQIAKYLGKEVSVTKQKFVFLGENSGEINLGGKKGFIGEVKEDVLKEFGLKKPVTIFEIEL